AFPAVRYAVNEPIDFFQQYSLRRAEDDMFVRSLGPPLRRFFIIGEMQRDLVVFASLQSDIAGEGRAVMQELEIVIVLGRIYLHLIGQAAKYKGEHLQRISYVERIGARDILDVGLVRPEFRRRCILGARGRNQKRRDERGGKTGQQV